jgi:glutamate-ammonia-ligase adenylyltransferase
MEGYLAYLRQHAHSWEKQALLKARCIAGDRTLGEAFLQQARPLIVAAPKAHLEHRPQQENELLGSNDPRKWGSSFPKPLSLDGQEEQAVRRAVHASKQRTEIHLHQQGRDWGEVKLGEGSIRDAEFVTQYLQLIHGSEYPEILQTNTLATIERLHAGGLLPNEDYRILHDGYIFLRTIEHFLQLLQYQQTHTLPSQPKAFAYLARRLGYSGERASTIFLARYEQYAQSIRTVYLRYVGEPEDQAAKPAEPVPDRADELLPKHLARLDAAYQAVFTPAEMRHHALLADSLDNEHLVRLETESLSGGAWRVTIVAYDYLGELSLICGLLYVYDLDILRGQVFTYEPLSETSSFEDRRAQPGGRKKIVDVFDVRPIARSKGFSAKTWDSYLSDLSRLLHLANMGERRQARVELAKRVALHLNEAPPARLKPPTSLYPVDIAIDNTQSDRYTLLQIESQDTPGFFYELTNALAFSRVNISRVVVGSAGSRVQDTLYVTEADGRKMLSEERQRELRTAVVLTKNFTHLLPSAPDPEAALLHFRELIEELFRRPNWVAELASIERPEVLAALARLLGVSEFMWDDLLRMQHANLFPVVQNIEGLAYPHGPAELEAALAQELAARQDTGREAGRDSGQDIRQAAASLLSTSGLPTSKDKQPVSTWVQALNAFKDRELFRIDMRHILSYTADFEQFAAELTDLVEVVVEQARQQCYVELVNVYGAPAEVDDTPARLSICALGKCGGRELGFASDIELMFIYSGSGWTSGPKSITSAEFYEKLVEKFISAIHAPRQGIFEIDLQLRPYGKSGSLAVSLEAFKRYFGPGGPAWAYERQALVRLRPIAGDAGFGEMISARRDELIYTGERFDVTAMRAMRERQVRHLVAGGTFNAKYSPGGLLDLEYLVQALQINAGKEYLVVRQTNTAHAIDALAVCGLLTSADHSQLKAAYSFLRWLIDSLRVVRGHAKDLTVPPQDSDAFAYLARRMGYGRQVQRLRNYLQRHSRAVMEINNRLLG